MRLYAHSSLVKPTRWWVLVAALLDRLLGAFLGLFIQSRQLGSVIMLQIA